MLFERSWCRFQASLFSGGAACSIGLFPPQCLTDQRLRGGLLQARAVRTSCSNELCALFLWALSKAGDKEVQA